MNDPKAKSRTMRIDLIPDTVGGAPLGSQPRQVVVTAHAGGAGFAPATRSAGQQSYQELFQSVYDSGIITDLRGRIRDVNRRAVEFFGYPMAAFRQMTIFNVICGASEEMLRSLFENLQRERFTLILAACETADRGQVICEIAVSQMRLSTPHLCFFVRDVSQRYAAEQMLRTEHAAIQNAAEPIVVVDTDRLIDYANPATLRLWDFAEDADMHDVPVGNLFASPDAILGVLENLGGETPTWSGDMVARRPDGSEFQVSVFASVNRDNDGDILGATLNFTDRSDALEAERLRGVLGTVSEKVEALSAWFNALSTGIPEEARPALRGPLEAGVAAIEDVVRALNAAGQGS